MHNNFLKTVGIIVVLASILVGCNQAAEPTVVDPYDNGQNNGGNGAQNQMVNAQGQMQRADLMGQIKSINGNEIVVKVAQIPQGQGQRTRNGNNNNQDRNNINNENNSDANQMRSNRRNQDAQNSNNQDQNNQNNRNIDPNAPRPSFDPEQMQQRRQRALNFTGEERTLMLPADLLIEKRSFNENGPQTENVKSDTLKVDDIIQVWFDETDKKKISRISMGQGGFGGGRGGFGGGRDGNNNRMPADQNQQLAQ